MTTNTIANTIAKPPTVPWQIQLIRLGFRSLGNLMPHLAGRLAFRVFATPQRRLISRHSKEIMAQAEVTTLPHSQGKLAVYTWGEGPMVLLVHGWENSASHMANFVQPLLDRGFRVVAFDAPAHGKSSGQRTNLVDMGQAIMAVIGAFGPVSHIVAHSFGGASTMFTLVQNRTIKIDKVVFLGAPANLSDVFARFAEFLHIPAAALQKMQHLIYQRFGFSVEYFSIERMAEIINFPGLVIHDRDDDVVPFSDAETIVKHWSQSRLLATEKLGHRKILYNQQVIEKVVHFLET